MGNATLLDNDGNYRFNISSFPIIYETRTAETGVRGQIATPALKHQLVFKWTGIKSETSGKSGQSTVIYDNLYQQMGSDDPGWGRLDSLTKYSERNMTGFVIGDIISTHDDRYQLMLGARRQTLESKSWNSDTGAYRPEQYYKDSATSPAVGFVYKPKSNLSFYTNYMEGLQRGGTAPVTAANALESLPAAKAKQFEIGAKYDWGKIASSLSLFQIKVPSAYTDAVTNLYGMYGEQQNRGIEMNIFGEPAKNFRLIGGVTIMDNKLKKTANGTNNGHKPQGVSDIVVALSGEWDVPAVDGLTLTGRVAHNGSQYIDAANTQKVPSWTTYDIGARYVIKSMDNPVTIRATVNNVFNKRYWSGMTYYDGRVYLGAARTFLLSASMSI